MNVAISPHGTAHAMEITGDYDYLSICGRYRCHAIDICWPGRGGVRPPHMPCGACLAVLRRGRNDDRMALSPFGLWEEEDAR